jgi:hypothetical protein
MGTTPDPLQAVYAPPTDNTSTSPAPGSGGGECITYEEAMAFAGPKKGSYYHRVWMRLRGEPGLIRGFNGAAFFLSIAWLLYRKMYTEFAIATGALVSLGIAEELLGLNNSSGQRALDRAVNIAIATTFGFIGNGLYYNRARRIIFAARQSEPDEKRRLEVIAKKGGTDIWLTLAGMIGLVVLLAIIGIVAEG